MTECQRVRWNRDRNVTWLWYQINCRVNLSSRCPAECQLFTSDDKELRPLFYSFLRVVGAVNVGSAVERLTVILDIRNIQ